MSLFDNIDLPTGLEWLNGNHNQNSNVNILVPPCKPDIVTPEPVPIPESSLLFISALALLFARHKNGIHYTTT